MSYKSFKGTKYKKIELSSGKILNLQIQMKTDSGDLKISLLDPNNNELYSAKNIEGNINEKININEDGKYKIQWTIE